MDQVVITKLKSTAIKPICTYNGYDLFSEKDYTIFPNKSAKVKTYIKMTFPASLYCELDEVERYSRCYNAGIRSWLIDVDEDGGIDVEIINFSKTEKLQILRGYKIVHISCQEYPIPMQINYPTTLTNFF